jgi:hypothetical protein
MVDRSAVAAIVLVLLAPALAIAHAVVFPKNLCAGGIRALRAAGAERARGGYDARGTRASRATCE